MSVHPLERLTKLYDGIEQLEDDVWDDDMSEVDDPAGENDDGVWLKDDQGIWRYHLHETDADEWEETDYDEEEGDEDDDDDIMDVDDDYSTDFMDISPPASSHPDTPPPPPESTTSMASSIVGPKSDVLAADNHEAKLTEAESDELPWKRFDILASAPHDHAFYASTPAQPSKTFLGRLSKEYRVLASSLPG